ncbi:uncharacterized protein si:dkeyp-110g5.4 [Epinephelus fuscoguttatus]|uniref:uncharacterized protein si:dkeyp-110g5.4 n=1 Tax=Epinephelus fuscoguttatus TaxID=293821 RepID=UPI0020D1AC85|nr:uncharacterized protein si:dkeyp-110g5.4 [Epinephelus fuscoguttatus]
MELLANLEIYIPVEAEVKSIPIRSLPKSVLRRIGLPLSDSEGSRKLTDSAEGIWICPVIMRMKGQKCATNTGNSVVENMSSLLGKEFRAQPGPFQMSFVSANPTAYKVLKDNIPGKNVSTHTSHLTSPLPHGTASQTYEDAVVIYHGNVYLSARRPSQRRSQRETRDPQPASLSSIPSASDLSTKSQKKHGSSEASIEPADTKPKRKKLRVILPQTSSKQLKDCLIKKDHLSTTDRELLNDHRPKEKHTTCEVTHSDKEKDVTHRASDVSSSKTAHSVLRSTDSLHKVDSHKDADGEQSAEKAAGTGPAWLQPQGEQEEVFNNDSGECELQDLGSKEADYIQIGSGESDSLVGIVEQRRNQSWTRRESQGAARAFTSLPECDFKGLAEEEAIDRMKAKLRKQEATLNSLPSS